MQVDILVFDEFSGSFFSIKSDNSLWLKNEVN